MTRTIDRYQHYPAHLHRQQEDGALKMKMETIKNTSIYLAMATMFFTRRAGLALAVLFTMLVGSVGADDSKLKLEGTWDVTLTFLPAPPTGCTGGGPIPTLNTFLKDGGMLFSAGSLFAGPGQGSWEHIRHNHFTARFKFLLFNPDGSRRGSEELTKDVRLTGPDTFEAITTFDFFDAAGNMTAHGCIINETATRFE
jgi:hypothetical protein